MADEPNPADRNAIARELINRILAAEGRFGEKKGHRSRDLLRFFQKRYEAGLPPASEKMIRDEVFGKNAVVSETAIRQAVANLRQVLSGFFENEGRDNIFRVEIPERTYHLRFYEWEPGLLRWFWQPHFEQRGDTEFAIVEPSDFADNTSSCAGAWSIQALCSVARLFEKFDKPTDVLHSIWNTVEPNRLRINSAFVVAGYALNDHIHSLFRKSSIGRFELYKDRDTRFAYDRSPSPSKGSVIENSEMYSYSIVTRVPSGLGIDRTGTLTVVAAHYENDITATTQALCDSNFLRQLRCREGFAKSIPNCFQLLIERPPGFETALRVLRGNPSIIGSQTY